MADRLTLAIVGATGLVGRTMVKVLEERDFPVSELILLASERSAGKKIMFKGKELTVETLNEKSFGGVKIALFSAGGDVSKKYAPIAAKAGCIVIDNSSAWRMHPEVPLVVPEVNPGALAGHHGIIANPNCSTIQLVVPLKYIHDKYTLRRVVVSTYQSISGAGQKGVDKLRREIAGNINPKDKHKIAYNIMFHSPVENSDFSVEEIKMMNETRKILSLPKLRVAVTCVRLPILGGHGESVNLETEKPFDVEDIRSLMLSRPGLVLMDDMQNDCYPTPEISADTDPVYVGRFRVDSTVENGLYMWVVADNLRKGAATNAVQIAETILNERYTSFENFNF